MSASHWEELASGTGCPYDAPIPTSNEYLDFVAELSISSFCLLKNQAYRGSCAVIFSGRHATRIDQLTSAEWSAFSQDLYVAHCTIAQAIQPDHMNVMLLGNSIPHLHWGIVPRYKSDPRWGHSIFTTSRTDMADVKLPAAEQMALAHLLREALVSTFTPR